MAELVKLTIDGREVQADLVFPSAAMPHRNGLAPAAFEIFPEWNLIIARLPRMRQLHDRAHDCGRDHDHVHFSSCGRSHDPSHGFYPGQLRHELRCSHSFLHHFDLSLVPASQVSEISRVNRERAPHFHELCAIHKTGKSWRK